MLITSPLPPRGNSRYSDALQNALLVPAGEYIKIDLETQQEARSAKSSLYQTIRRNGYGVNVLLRGNSVYIGRAK